MHKAKLPYEKAKLDITYLVTCDILTESLDDDDMEMDGWT